MLTSLQCIRSLIQLIAKPESQSKGKTLMKLLIPEIIVFLNNPTYSSRRNEKSVSECIKTLGIAVTLTASQPQQQQGILSIVIPSVLCLLQPEKPVNNVVHQLALQYLTQTAPEFPLQFKTILSQVPSHLKQKLETSIRVAAQFQQQQQQQQQFSTQRVQTQQQQQPQNFAAKPTIQLKMNFDNFS